MTSVPILKTSATGKTGLCVLSGLKAAEPDTRWGSCKAGKPCSWGDSTKSERALDDAGVFHTCEHPDHDFPDTMEDPNGFANVITSCGVEPAGLPFGRGECCVQFDEPVLAPSGVHHTAFRSARIVQNHSEESLPESAQETVLPIPGPRLEESDMDIEVLAGVMVPLMTGFDCAGQTDDRPGPRHLDPAEINDIPTRDGTADQLAPLTFEDVHAERASKSRTPVVVIAPETFDGRSANAR